MIWRLGEPREHPKGSSGKDWNTSKDPWASERPLASQTCPPGLLATHQRAFSVLALVDSNQRWQDNCHVNTIFRRYWTMSWFVALTWYQIAELTWYCTSTRLPEFSFAGIIMFRRTSSQGQVNDWQDSRFRTKLPGWAVFTIEWCTCTICMISNYRYVNLSSYVLYNVIVQFRWLEIQWQLRHFWPIPTKSKAFFDSFCRMFAISHYL